MQGERREKLLRQVELAKQGWAGVTVEPVQPQPEPAAAPGEPDSGTESALGEGEARPERGERQPMGSLGDFISLAGYSSGEEDQEQRLI